MDSGLELFYLCIFDTSFYLHFFIDMFFNKQVLKMFYMFYNANT